MTFGLPIAASTLWVIAAGLAAAATVAYVLKMRRRRFEVPFSTLWHRVLREKQNSSLWRKLKRLLSLLLQLCILGLIVFAVADPHIGSAPDDAKHVVVIVDASASMKARDAGADGTGPRIDDALSRAHDLVRSLGSGDAAMVMRMDGRTTPLSRFESDKAVLHSAIDSIRANDTPADLRSALTAASDALRGRKNPLIVIIGDGAYPTEVLEAAVWTPVPVTADFAQKRLAAIDLSGIDVRHVPVGRSGSNIGIVGFNVRRYVTNKLSYEVFIEVQNFADSPAGVELTLYNGESAIDVATLALGPREAVRQIFPNLGGGDGHRLRAVAKPVATESGASIDDVFPLDNEAYALLPARKRQKVLLVSADNLYLEGAMIVYDNIQIDKLTPAEYDRMVGDPTLPAYDVVVFDGHTPARLPERGHLVYFGPEGEHSPFPIATTLSAPRITATREHHPVMKWLQLGDVNFGKLSVFAIDRAVGDLSLATSVRSTVIAAKKASGRKTLAFGFSVGDTDMVLRVAWPLLLVNSLDWLSGDDADLITTYTTGRRFRVPMDAGFRTDEVTVRMPDGRKAKAPVSDGLATFFGTRVGIHRLTAKDDAGIARVELAANLSSPTESDIRPPGSLVLGDRTVEPPAAFTVTRRRSIWLYLALLAVLLMAVEWVTYNRRITV